MLNYIFHQLAYIVGIVGLLAALIIIIHIVFEYFKLSIIKPLVLPKNAQRKIEEELIEVLKEDLEKKDEK